MTWQHQAPPLDHEPNETPATYRGEVPREYQTWVMPSGWCSACLRRGVRVVRFGGESRCVALCEACVGLLSEVIKRDRVAELEDVLRDVVHRPDDDGARRRARLALEKDIPW